MTKLADIKKEFEKYLVIKDRWALDMVFATVLGNGLLTGDSIWTMLIAPSSGAKSTFIAPCNGLPTVYFLDDLTEKTFLSGYKLKGKNMSLLKEIGSGILCFSDFTAILGKNPVSRSDILGQLRLVYDGTFKKRTGTGEVSWTGKMGFLGACTPEIYHLLEGSRAMGERFMYYMIDQPSDAEVVAKQKEAAIPTRILTEIMRPMYMEYVLAVVDFYRHFDSLKDFALSPNEEEAVNKAAQFAALAKATVHMDFKTSKPDSLVNKPGAGRDRRMFANLLHVLKVMESYEVGMVNQPDRKDHIDLIYKCAYSSVSRERRKVLEILATYGESLSSSQIGATDGFGLQKDAVDKYLHVLHAVGLIKKRIAGSSHRWYMNDDSWVRDFICDVNSIIETKKWTEGKEDQVLSPSSEEDPMFDEFLSGSLIS